VVLNNKTKRMILIFVWAVIVLSIILSLVEARFEEQKATLSTGTIESLWWAGKILFFVSMPLWISLVVLLFYADWLRGRVDTIELAARLRTAASIIPWLTIVLLALIGTRFVIVLYYRSDHLIPTSIKFLLLSLCLGFSLFYYWPMAKYCRVQPLNRIVAVCLREQHDKFVKASKFDKAYSALLKACEAEPDGFWLWCKLALFCQITRKCSAEADKYMAKASELIETNKANSINEKASYFDCLGLINYTRGEYQKALDCSKQAMNIESTPERIRTYEQLLSELDNKQQDTAESNPKNGS
jgi:tetratricopeptide (TPR) repeat protein